MNVTHQGTFRHAFLTERPSLPSGNLCSAGNSCQIKQGGFQLGEARRGTVPGTGNQADGTQAVCQAGVEQAEPEMSEQKLWRVTGV